MILKDRQDSTRSRRETKEGGGYRQREPAREKEVREQGKSKRMTEKRGKKNQVTLVGVKSKTYCWGKTG